MGSGWKGRKWRAVRSVARRVGGREDSGGDVSESLGRLCMGNPMGGREMGEERHTAPVEGVGYGCLLCIFDCFVCFVWVRHVE